MQTLRTQMSRIGIAVIAVGVLAGAAWHWQKPEVKLLATDVSANVQELEKTADAADPAPTTHVTVNGVDVPAGTFTTTTEVKSEGKSVAQVSVSNNGRVVAIADTKSTEDRSTDSRNLNVSVQSSSNGGSSWGNTQVFGTNFSNSSNGTTSGFTSTQVFSTEMTSSIVTP